MSIATRIESITEHLEKDWESIGDIGGDTSVNNNIENIATSLEEVYEDMPKIEATGTELSLSPTKKGKMEIELSPSELEQETTTGKNLLGLLNGTYSDNGITIVASNGMLTLNGTSTDIAIVRIDLINNINWTNGLSYTIYGFNDVADGDVRIRISSNGDNDTVLSTTNASNTFTCENASQYINNRLLIRVKSGITLTNFKIKPMISTSSSETVYEEYTGGQPSPSPQYPQQIHTVSGENSVKVGNKNLAKSDWASDFVSRINDSSKANLTTFDNKNCLHWKPDAGYGDYDNKYMFKTNWKANTQYTFSFDIYTTSQYGYDSLKIEYTDGTASELLTSANTWEHKIITSTSGKTIKYLRVDWRNGESYIDINTFQVEEGTTATSYEPHKEQTYPISLGDLEYCKIGDYEDLFFKNVIGSSEYQSNLELNKWYLKKNIGKYTITSFNGKSGTTNNQMYSTVVIDNIKKPTSGGTTSDILSTHGISKAPNTLYSNDTIGIGINTNGTIAVAFGLSSSLTTLELANTWVSTNNIDAYFPLATPTYTLLNATLQTQLDNIQKAISYQEQTNVSQTNADLPFVLKISALLDANAYIEHLEAQIEALS